MTHLEIERIVREALMSCFGADLIQSVELDEPFFEEAGVSSLERLSILATIDSRLGAAGGTLTRELGARASPSIRSLIAFVEEAVARKTGDGPEPREHGLRVDHRLAR